MMTSAPTPRPRRRRPWTQETESASPTSEEPNRLKSEALRRLKALERRDKTVGTHLDELRVLLTLLFEQLPD